MNSVNEYVQLIFDTDLLSELMKEPDEPYIMSLPPLPIYGNLTLEQYDKGPWLIAEYEKSGKIYIQSDDFKYDVALEVSGDFGDAELKRKYAKSIADVLNAYYRK